jgi:hypothetical protein
VVVLAAIDGLGGMHHSMTDEAVVTAQKHGVALLYFIIFSKSTSATFSV